jgi:enoyl-CoA hydratase
MILTGTPIGADQALRIGLVNRVAAAAALMTEARALAAQLAKNAPIAMRYIINAVNNGAEIPFREACQYEATLFGLVASTEDMKEGTTAFALPSASQEFNGRETSDFRSSDVRIDVRASPPESSKSDIRNLKSEVKKSELSIYL